VLENNIIPQSERSAGETVEDLYKLEHNPKLEDGEYKIRISEFEQERSEFEDFELIRVSHPKDTEVGVINDKIVGYKKVADPQKVIVEGKEIPKDKEIKRDEGQDAEIFLSDDEFDFFVSKTALRTGDRRLKKAKDMFAEADDLADITKKILIASILGASKVDAAIVKYSIYYYNLTQKGKEVELGVSHPRENFSTHLLDTSKIDENKLTLKWTETHKMIPVGTAKRIDDESLKIEKITPKEITHSKEGSVDKNLVLEPGELLTLKFPDFEKKDSDLKNTFLLRSRGYYEQI
jgi:hypothetical protein